MSQDAPEYKTAQDEIAALKCRAYDLGQRLQALQQEANRIVAEANAIDKRIQELQAKPQP